VVAFSANAMASVWTAALSAHLEDDQVAAVKAALRARDIDPLEDTEDAEAVMLDRAIDDDVLADFLDQLDAADAACDIYLPVDFEEVLEVGSHRLGSAHALILALEGLRDDLAIEEDEDEDEDDEDEDDEDEDDEDEDVFGEEDPQSIELKDEQIRDLWRLFFRGAQSAIARRFCLFVQK
jgi:hypothetical protein